MANIITIDGPGSSGKDTVGKLLAQRLNYQFLDSGCLYRACCVYLLTRHLPVDNEENNAKYFHQMNLQYLFVDNQPKVSLDNQDITDKLHTKEVDAIVAVIAAQKMIREEVKQMQRKMAEKGNFIVAGRDIGSEIFPDAQVKFYLTASVEERAKRRYQQYHQQNLSCSYQEVLDNLKKRDTLDSTRVNL